MTILHEDNQIIVLMKQVGVSSEETQDGMSVPALLRAHWGNEKAYVGVIHRLDTGVGGVMVYAKTSFAASELSKQVQDRTMIKEYRCICAGIPEPAQGEMRDFLFKDSKKGKVFPVKGARKGAKEAPLANLQHPLGKLLFRTQQLSADSLHFSPPLFGFFFSIHDLPRLRHAEFFLFIKKGLQIAAV